MPCVTDGSAEDREEANRVTDMLCRVCALMETNWDVCKEDMPPDVLAWWAEHKKKDKKRKKEEQKQERKKKVRKEVIEKLTAEERDALGIGQ